MNKVLELLNVTEDLDMEKDTVGSAFIKGMTDTYIKGVLIGGLVHLGIKGYEHLKGRNSED